jgi:DnaJ-class molecular chaperone
MYRKQALKFHPDKNNRTTYNEACEKLAELKFKQLEDKCPKKNRN